MTKIYSLLFLTVFATQNVSAQDDDFQKRIFFTTGVGGSYVNVIDQGISPLLYSGVGGAAQFGHIEDREKGYSQSYGRFDFNLLDSETSGATIYSYKAEGSYQHYFKSLGNDEGKWRFYTGFSTHFKWVLRDHTSFTNNSQHIETRFSLAPSAMLRRPFELWSKSFELGLFTHLPLITYANRPLFASTKFPALVNNEDPAWYDYLTNGKVYSWGKYFNIRTQTYLNYYFKNGNGLKLDYYWSYDSLKDVNPIKTGEHAIIISTLFKL
ncbi:hypothetical protein GCM10027429_00450 [Marivirga atlantica]|jgi:hypothetical protein|uniref:Outer membrane protein beta-barrel domain-containing protein n=1 Tax=Marivirga atlantica TaxID=1548457 RepID=A0A937DH50_9BACT|nr:hypothetical protein [Marivirga atlantica]MBL0763655.1 hypothetical protein [Marivirga atlantica]